MTSSSPITFQYAQVNSSNSEIVMDSQPNQLYMGDLDLSWNEAELKHIWASLGEPNVSIKMVKNQMGFNNNPGYCFVEFPSSLSASNALLKNGVEIPQHPSKFLKLNWASFTSPQPGNEFSIFVGDLAPNVSESQLFEIFISRYPSTLSSKIVFDQVTNVSKGYGFVKFGNELEQQRSLLEMQGVFLNGRPIRVSTTSKSKSRFNNINLLQNVVPAVPHTSQFIYQVNQQPPLTQFTDPSNTTVFIGGLSSLVSEEELRSCFQPFGQIVYVKIPVGKGCGFVQYVDRVAAETAIAKMQGFPIGNSRIRLSWGRSAKQAAVMQQAFTVAVQNQQHPALLQYSAQPSMPTTYNYNVSSLPGTGSSYVPLSNDYTYNSNSMVALLPGISSNFDHSINNSLVSSSMFQFNGNLPSQLNPNISSNPQILLRDSDLFVRNSKHVIDRLEHGSNGFIFA